MFPLFSPDKYVGKVLVKQAFQLRGQGMLVLRTYFQNSKTNIFQVKISNFEFMKYKIIKKDGTSL